MKKVFKINLAAVFAVLMVFGLMSFNLMRVVQPTEQWHEITFNDPADEEDDVIGQPINAPEDEHVNCVAAITNDYRCAVLITYDPSNFNPVNQTVGDVDDSPLATVDERAFRDLD